MILLTLEVNMTSKTAYLYLRASSAKQDKSVDQQRAECTDYAAKNGIRIVKEFVDDGISAYKFGKDGRKGFSDLIGACSSNGVDYVLLWNIDRFSRQYKEGMVELLQLEITGVNIIDTLDGVYQSDDLGGAIKQVLGLFGAEQYSKKLSANVKRGLKQTVEKGYLLSTPPLGLKRQREDGGTIWVVNPDETECVELIFDLFDQGWNYTEIARHLNENGYKPRRAKYFSAFSVKYILRNETYGGYQKGKKAKIETFIPKDKWKRCFDRSNVKPYQNQSPRRKKPLTGHVYCSECGDLAHLTTASKDRTKYVCRGVRWGSCTNKNYLYSDSLELEVYLMWKGILENDGLEKIAKKVVAEANKILKKNKISVKPMLDRIEELDDAEQNLIELAVSAGGQTELLAKKLQEIDDERKSIQEKLKNVDTKLIEISSEQSVEIVKTSLKRLNNLSLISDYIKKITIVDDQVAKIQMFGKTKTVHLKRDRI